MAMERRPGGRGAGGRKAGSAAGPETAVAGDGGGAPVERPDPDAAEPHFPSADALAALAALDPALAPLVAAVGTLPERRSRAGFAGLAWIVVGQQVSVASANAIWARVETAFPDLQPPHIRVASDEALRACGLSGPKIRTLRAIAEAVHEGRLDIDELAALPAEDAQARLVAVKGIGPWTAEMFLMSCLNHPDVFPAGDLALQEIARLVFGLPARPDVPSLRRMAEAWAPHRASAARLFWAYHKVVKGRDGAAQFGGAPAGTAALSEPAMARAPKRTRSEAQGKASSKPQAASDATTRSGRTGARGAEPPRKGRFPARPSPSASAERQELPAVTPKRTRRPRP